MTMKPKPVSKRIFGFAQPLIKIVVLVALIFATVVFWDPVISEPAQKLEERLSKPLKVYKNAEYGFSISNPAGWSYEMSPEKTGVPDLIVELVSADKKTRVPIFVEEKSWDLVESEVRKNFKPETIEETIFAGQPSMRIIVREEINPSYTYLDFEQQYSDRG
jgi:hypothetical protein